MGATGHTEDQAIKWGQRLGPASCVYDHDKEAIHLSFKAVPPESSWDFPISKVPKGLGVVMSLNQAVEDLTLKFHGNHPTFIEVRGPRFKSMRAELQGSLDHFLVAIESSYKKMELHGVWADTLSIEGGVAALHACNFQRLMLTDCVCRIVAPPGTVAPATRVKVFGVKGGVRIDGQLVAETTNIFGRATILSEQQLELGWILPETDDSHLRLLEGSFTSTACSNGLNLEVRDASLVLAQEAPRTVDSLKIEGYGSISSSVVLQQPRFSPSDERALTIEAAADVLDASGRVELEMARPITCSGDAQDPLILERLKGIKGGQLHDAQLYALGTADLSEMEELARLVPRIKKHWPVPTRWRAYPEDGHGPEGPRPPAEPLTPSQSAHFWSSVAAMLAEKHAPGSQQSEVRYMAARLRRRSSLWGGERILLSAYSLVGYGERILRPLLLLGISTTLLWLLFMDWSVAWTPTSRGLWWDLLVSPLEFFRFVQAPKPVGQTQEVALLLHRVVGVLMLFFSISATRRLAKAE